MKIKLKPISEQVVVVFGASSGIGRITALEFARRGARIAVAARSEEGLASLVEEIRQVGGEAFYVKADAADFNQVKTVAGQTFDHYGQLDTWVHSAAAMIFSPFEKITPEEFKRLIEVNLLGQVYGAMAALPFLRKTGGGALIHISSVEAYRTLAYQSAYGASKHGIKGFIQALRDELKMEDDVNIAVTEIMPGPINTPLWDKGRNKFAAKERPPTPTIYHPRLVADAVLYAAENEVRDLVVGGAAALIPLLERFSPRLQDKIMRVIGNFQFDQENQPPNAPDNLFTEISGQDFVEGRFSEQQIKRDPYTWAMTNPRKAKTIFALAGGLLGGFLAYKVLKSPDSK